MANNVAYEDKMVDDNIADIMDKLKAMLDDAKAAVNKEKIMAITNGQEAAFAVLQLMKAAQQTIPPVDIVNTFKKTKKRTEICQKHSILNSARRQ
jgi:hypothetical protein